jgi:RimJ/RimL family protein N-acetyltransferase
MILGDYMKFTFKAFSYETNDEHQYDDFMQELRADKSTKTFLPNVSKKINKNSIYNNSYIVKDLYSDTPIGYVHLFGPENDDLKLLYAVHPDYRREGYGSSILRTTTEFALQRNKNLNQVSLIINANNLASSRTASKAGFKQASDSSITYVRKR